MHPDSRLRLLRRYSTPMLDAAVWAAGMVCFALLRLNLNPHRTFTWRFGEIVFLAVALQVLVGYLTQLYRVRWRIASFEELVALGWTIGAVAVILLIVDVVGSSHAAPASVLIAAAALSLVASGAIRSAWRLWSERGLRPSSGATRTVVLGVGQAGIQLVDSLLHTPDSPYVPVALLDDDPDKSKLRIRHLQVQGGTADLPEVARDAGAETVVVAIPSAGGDLIRRVSELASGTGLAVRVLPTVGEMLDDKVGPESIRPVTPADLLGRRVIRTDVVSIAGYITGRRVLVTGAGGSIGSELCRQLTRFGPECLTMLDRDESALHAVQLSIEGRALLDSRHLVVCDIRDRDALREVFGEHRPEVVFHAAALKHLPLLEMWPSEAVKTNVQGTQNVIDAAMGVGVSKFVNVSTDKAANPVSVLGYSKRIAERLTAAAAPSGSGIYLSVRFGNVLGSRGSVLVSFYEQIAKGGPVTVTDPDVTRYFMTIGEAVELVIQAGAVGKRGEVLILDMGSPVRISDVAERLIIESGQPVEIEYTGLRTGEKLQEDLFGEGESDHRPSHPLISQTAVPPLMSDVVWSLLPAADGRLVRDGLARLCQSVSVPVRASRSAGAAS